MDRAVAVGKFLGNVSIRLLLVIDLEVAFIIINENTNLPDGDLFALLHPYDLPVVIHGLHRVAGYPNSEISAFGDLVLREADNLEVAFIQKRTSTSGDRQIADGHIDIADDTADLGRGSVFPAGNQICFILLNLTETIVV